MAIVSSGEERTFESGAVRDLAKKGRVDLLPWTVIGTQYAVLEDPKAEEFCAAMDEASHGRDVRNSLDAMLYAFIDMAFESDFEGAILEVAHHYQDGLERYPMRNWEKGIDIWSYLDSCGRHFLKYKRKDTDERHDRAVLWNILCAMYTIDHNIMPL